MFNIGGGEILVILIVALIVLGPDKLPSAMRQAGKALGEVRKVSDGFRRELKDAMADDEAAEASARDRGRQLGAPPADAVPLDALPGSGGLPPANGDGSGNGTAPAEADGRPDG